MQRTEQLFFLIFFVLLMTASAADGVIVEYMRMRHKTTGQLVEGFGDYHRDIFSDVSPGFDQKLWLVNSTNDEHKATTHTSVEDWASFAWNEEAALGYGYLGIQENWDNVRRSYKSYNEPIKLLYKGILFASEKRCRAATTMNGLATILQDQGISAHNAEEDRRPFDDYLETAVETLGASAIMRHRFTTVDGKPIFELNPKEQRGLLGLYRIEATKALRKVSNNPEFAAIHRYMMDVRPGQLKKELSSSFIDQKKGIEERVTCVSQSLVDLHFANETIKNAHKKHMRLIGGAAHIRKACKILEDSGQYEMVYQEGDYLNMNDVIPVLDLKETVERARGQEVLERWRKQSPIEGNTELNKKTTK